MKKILYISAAILSVAIPGASFAGDSGMPEVDFKQFVCSTLEGETDRQKALLDIVTQIGSIISQDQKDILLDIRDSEAATKDLELCN